MAKDTITLEFCIRPAFKIIYRGSIFECLNETQAHASESSRNQQQQQRGSNSSVE